jgi:hypothetical protein
VHVDNVLASAQPGRGSPIDPRQQLFSVSDRRAMALSFAIYIHVIRGRWNGRFCSQINTTGNGAETIGCIFIDFTENVNAQGKGDSNAGVPAVCWYAQY